MAFAAATSIATIGLYVSYGIPILVGLIYHQQFKKGQYPAYPQSPNNVHASGANDFKGPFNLGAFSRPVALIACLWISFITIIFCLPNANPVTSKTLNYTPVAVGIVCVWTFGSWFITARKWFVGPIRQIQAEELGIDIEEPGALEEAEARGKLAMAAESEKHVVQI